MKTIKTRVEALERTKENKPILVLWGDLKDENICWVRKNSFTWAEAEERFGNDYFLIRVQYVNDWRGNDY